MSVTAGHASSGHSSAAHATSHTTGHAVVEGHPTYASDASRALLTTPHVIGQTAGSTQSVVQTQSQDQEAFGLKHDFVVAVWCIMVIMSFVALIGIWWTSSNQSRG